MEPLNITHIEIDNDPDLGELYMLINADQPLPAVSWLVDDERNFYFRVHPETNQVVGAMALFANDWFTELAEAFRTHDLNHPDVRLFPATEGQCLVRTASRWDARRRSRAESRYD